MKPQLTERAAKTQDAYRNCRANSDGSSAPDYQQDQPGAQDTDNHVPLAPQHRPNGEANESQQQSSVEEKIPRVWLVSSLRYSTCTAIGDHGTRLGYRHHTN
jgi:hypothetical protein